MRNNAKSAVSDLEYQCSMVRQEKQQLTGELQALQERVAELHMQCQCHLEDKRQLKAVLSETQRHLGDVERRLAEEEQALANEKRLRLKEVCLSSQTGVHVYNFDLWQVLRRSHHRIVVENSIIVKN
jgi:chromosome segregation ATPase